MIATIAISAPVAGAALGVAGVLAGLWINGDRAERQRRRDLHARALAAVIDYGEMPFMIRRRRVEDEHRSAERVRLSDHFSRVKAEISTCQVLLAADGDTTICSAYKRLFKTARDTAGQQAHEAWKADPIASDPDMNMGPLHAMLAPFRDQLETFEADLARATLPRRLRIVRWLRGVDL